MGSIVLIPNMITTNKHSSFKLLITFYLHSLCIWISLVNSNAEEEFERVWLRHVQVECMKQKLTNAAEVLSRYNMCVYSATIQCVRDDDNFSKSSIKQRQFYHFCGFVHGFGVNDKNLQWIINTKSQLSTRLYFMLFSLEHRRYRCILEKFVVNSKSRNERYCGNRFPWADDYVDRVLHLSFTTEYPDATKQYFKLQYFKVKRPFRTIYMYLNQHGGVIPYVDGFNSGFRYHILSRYKIQTVSVLMEAKCTPSTLICYDGPGNYAPVIYSKRENATLHATSYQIICYIYFSNNSCTFPAKLHYWFESIFLKNKPPPQHITRRDIYGYGEGRDSWQNAVQWYYHDSRDSIRRSNSHRAIFHGPYTLETLLENESCMYGGVFVYQYVPGLVDCLHCLNEAKYKKNHTSYCKSSCPFDNSKIDNCLRCVEKNPATIHKYFYVLLCLSCLGDFNESVKEIWAQCTKTPYQDGESIYFPITGPLLFVLIDYQAYSKVRADIRFDIFLKQMTGIITLGQSVPIHCLAEENISQDFDGDFTKELDTSMQTFHFIIQPLHRSNIIFDTYSFLFTEPKTIKFSFSTDFASGLCAYCILNYVSYTFFTNTKQHVKKVEYVYHHNYISEPQDPTQQDPYKRFYLADERLESPVNKITVHLEDCKQLTYINWLLIIESVGRFYTVNDVARYTPEISAPVNSTYTLLYDDALFYPIYLQFNSRYEDYWGYWWYIISLLRVSKHATLKLRQNLPCEISDVYLERISKDGSHSTMYHWTELPEPQYITWITGCINCNIIYVADPFITHSSNCSQSARLELRIHKHKYFMDTLLAAKKDLLHNRIEFYKFR